MPLPPIDDEICVSARSSAAALEVAQQAGADEAITGFRTALVDGRPLPGLEPGALVRYVPPALTREVLEVRGGVAVDPADPQRGWVVVEAVTALGRSDVPLHLTVLVDVSGSMDSAPLSALSSLQDLPARNVSRLALAQEVLKDLVARLPAQATVSISAFVREQAAVVLPPTPATEHDMLVRAIRRVDGEAVRSGRAPPLQLAYDLAGANLDGCADRRILIVTDDAARFELDPDEVQEQVEGWAARGVEMWTLSLGTSGVRSPSIEALVAAGQGGVVYADMRSEALEPLAAALRATGTVGRQPKVSVSFPPGVSWRRMDGARGQGVDSWVLPERIGAGYRRVELYEVSLPALPEGTEAGPWSVTWSMQSPVPGEWTKGKTLTLAPAPLTQSAPLVTERVLAWTVGEALSAAQTDWTALGRWAEPLVRTDGPAREIQGWLPLLAR
jgi:hypothetical protein